MLCSALGHTSHDLPSLATNSLHALHRHSGYHGTSACQWQAAYASNSPGRLQTAESGTIDHPVSIVNATNGSIPCTELGQVKVREPTWTLLSLATDQSKCSMEYCSTRLLSSHTVNRSMYLHQGHRMQLLLSLLHALLPRGILLPLDGLARSKQDPIKHGHGI